MEGDCVTEKRVVGLKVRPGATIRALPGDFSTSGTLKADEPPALLGASRKDVTLDGEFTTENSYRYELRIHGGLSDIDAPFDFSFRICSLRGYLLKADAIKAKWGKQELPFECFEETIMVPVGRIDISVKFPNGSALRPFALVTYGESAHVPPDERQRVETGFSVTNSSARLILEKPKPGYRYLICWDGTSLAKKRPQ